MDRVCGAKKKGERRSFGYDGCKSRKANFKQEATQAHEAYGWSDSLIIKEKERLIMLETIINDAYNKLCERRQVHCGLCAK